MQNLLIRRGVPSAPEVITVHYPRIEPFNAQPLKIGSFCDKNPSLPVSMQETEPESSRFLNVLEKKQEQSRRQMADALGRLSYVADRQLFAVVTADAGCGKSTLIRRFVSSLPKEDYIFLYLSDSKLTPRWFYKGMLDQLGIESRFYRGDAKRQLQKEVEIIRGVQGKKVVCILDEAHLLEKLRLQRYAAVRQRIDINCVLPHLDRSETERYINSHLTYAGGRQDIFTDKAVDEIYRESTGIPRRINRICNGSLMYASQQNKRLIDEHLVRYVLEHEMLGGDVK